MDRLVLGESGIDVSEFCLGTMTWGSQNTESEGHAQMGRALDAGCDFWDTAEMYPVNPVTRETVGVTKSIVGSWFARNGRRKDVVIATKCSGHNEGFVREGQPVTGATLREALGASLGRLQTDYVDLYQLHWPNRGSYHFRQIWEFDPSGQDRAAVEDNFADVMETLAALVAEGRIRAFGLSNESAWGTMQWLRAGAATGGPRIASIQNEYSLLCRQFDTDLGELSHNENITLLAYSPLAAGLLSGKYQNGDIPEGSRMGLNPNLGGRKTERAFEAVAAYRAVAARHGIDAVKMALAWTRTRPFPTIPIFGATSMAQLDTALGAVGMRLDADVLSDLDTVHRAHPMPF